MKPIFKTFVLLFCLQFSLTAKAQVKKKDNGGVRATSAQKNKNGFVDITPVPVSLNKNYHVGIWEFIQFGTDSANLGPSAQGVLKINTDSTFKVVRYQNDQAYITQTGTYNVKTADFYLQKTLFQLPVFGTRGLGEDFKINYKFSADKKRITLSYTAYSGEVCYEVWRKL